MKWLSYVMCFVITILGSKILNFQIENILLSLILCVYLIEIIVGFYESRNKRGKRK